MALLIWGSFISICIHVFINGIRCRKSGSYKLPPGPYPFPIIGSLFKLGNKPHESLTNLAKIYGPIMTLKLGSLTTVVVSSPIMAQQILQKHDKVFSHRTVLDAVRALDHHKGSLVWLQPSHQWLNLRKICNSQIFSSHNLDRTLALRHRKVQELLSFIGDNGRKGLAVDIGQATFTTSLNILSNTLFSVDLAHFKSESKHEFKDIIHGIMKEAGKPNLVDFFPMLCSLDPQGVRRSMEIHIGKLYELFDELIEERLHDSYSTSVKNDFLDALLDEHKQNPSEFGLTSVKRLLLDLLVAGTDTTSSTLEWAMAEFLHNPEIMAKARLEIEENVGKNKHIEESDIAKLPYLRAFVKETLRLHPPGPLLVPHKANTEVEISGFMVPKNAQVLVNMWSIGRDSSIWKNPNLFMPERFLGLEMDFKGQDFELIPFGGGRRICPGLPLASKVLHLVLTSVVQSFEWKIERGMGPQDMNMDEKFGITLHKAEPLVAIPVKI